MQLPREPRRASHTAWALPPAGKAEVHLIYPSAGQAAAAAEGFRGPWARKALRMPDSEPAIEVKVLEIKPPAADWHARCAGQAAVRVSTADDKPCTWSGWALHLPLPNWRRVS